MVTGAGGFVGAVLVAHFRDRGRAFVAAVRDDDRNPSSERRRIGDLALASEAALDALVRDAGAVVHLAGRAHVMDETERDPETEYQLANAEATARLASAASRSGVRRFILASTIKVNGESSPGGRPFRPDDPPDPQDAYARSKLAAERALFEAANGSSMTPIVLRLPLVYGPGVRGNFRQLVDAIVARRVMPVGAIRNRRSLIYVGNLVDAIDAALDAPVSPSGVHFIADDEPVSTPALVRAIAAAWQVKPNIVAVPVPILRLAGAALGKRGVIARLTESLEVDATVFREATGWVARCSLDAALAKVAAAERSGVPARAAQLDSQSSR